jgi:DNA polymerase-3 subunit delta'
MSTGLPSWLEPALSRGLSMPAHALLLHGPGTLGQFELALELARAMLCESPDANARACGRCTACHLFELRSHTDLSVLVPDALREALGWAGADEDDAASKGKAKPSRYIKVDAVRSAIDWAHQSS